MIENVAIVGMGALGLLFGAQLKKTLGPTAVRFVMDEERFERHKNDIYTVNGREEKFILQKASEATPADLVLVATKYNDLAAALEEMEKLVGPNTVLLSLLNGVSSEDLLAQRYGEEKVVPCVALGMDAVREGSALVYRDPGRLRIGAAVPAQKKALAAVRELFDRTKVPYELPADIVRALWAKLIMNVGINQTCMVYATDYGGAFQLPEAREHMLAAMREVMAVAEPAGVKLNEDDFTDALKVLHGLAPRGIPSMRQDALAKRKTEVELFAGTVAALGKKYGVPTPVNSFYLQKIKEMEASY